MHIKTILPILFILLTGYSYSQTYSGTGGIITDDGVINDFVIDIGDLSPETLSAEHGLTTVCITITHSWVSDLDVRLISPSGENIMLTSGLGGDTDNYDNTCFNMTSDIHITRAGPPFNGTYLPFTPLGNVNNGLSGNGKWILRILDTYAYADGGELLNWNLTFDADAPVSDVFPGTKLPIILLTTDNQTIPNDPKIKGLIKVISNESGALNYPWDIPLTENFIGIEVRGSSSQMFPKKNYSFETQDINGEDFETSLIGLPAEEDWILYAPYTDKSFHRDAITYQLGNEVGQYAPRTRACELFLNGDYQGVYYLEEKIKRDKNRVDIKKLNPIDTIGDELTGGYLLKVDRDNGEGSYFVSKFEGTYPDEEIRLVYEDPEGQDLHPKQKEYISTYFDSFEVALYSEYFTDSILGYRRYVDMKSLVDYFIVTELGHNIDAYRLSSFLYKDRNDVDSTFHFGPLWDFNLAFGNADYCSGQLVEGWGFDDSGACGNTPLWWARFMQDPYFQNRLKCRYDSLRETTLSTSSVLHLVDSLTAQLGNAPDRNYERWPILGIYIWPNSFIGNTYEEELNFLRQWLMGRLDWMDANIPGECLIVSGIENVADNNIILSPNPANGTFTIKDLEGMSDFNSVTIADINGRELRSHDSIRAGEEIDISNFAPGLYFVTARNNTGKLLQHKLIVQH